MICKIKKNPSIRNIVQTKRNINSLYINDKVLDLNQDYTEMHIKARILYNILLTDWKRLRTDPLRLRTSPLDDMFLKYLSKFQTHLVSDLETPFLEICFTDSSHKHARAHDVKLFTVSACHRKNPKPL